MARTATHKPRTNKDKVTELHLATYNVRTLSDECHLVSLENEIEKIKWDIIGISKMRRPGENDDGLSVVQISKPSTKLITS